MLEHVAQPVELLAARLLTRDLSLDVALVTGCLIRFAEVVHTDGLAASGRVPSWTTATKATGLSRERLAATVRHMRAQGWLDIEDGGGWPRWHLYVWEMPTAMSADARREWEAILEERKAGQ